MEVRRVDLANWALRTSHRISQQVLNITSIRVFDQIRDPEIPNTLRPNRHMHICKVICPKAGLPLDMHYQVSAYLSLLDKRKE